MTVKMNKAQNTFLALIYKLTREDGALFPNREVLRTRKCAAKLEVFDETEPVSSVKNFSSSLLGP